MGADPVNNISPEMSAGADKYAKRMEDYLLSGRRLWQGMVKKGEMKKLYFVGSPGINGPRLVEAVGDALAYIPAEDGTQFMRRRAGVVYPKIQYYYWDMEKQMKEKAPISPADLWMDNEEEYRELEKKIFMEYANQDTSDYPAVCLVSDTASVEPYAIEEMKKGIVIWLDSDPEFSWSQTQWKPKQGGGLFVPKDESQRPPVWALANGWDGDVDDGEAKLEYIEILRARDKIYEEIAQIRMRTDISGVQENPFWGGERIIKALSELIGVMTTEDSIEEALLSKDLEKLLSGARLSKYYDTAIKWCEEQGAASIEDVAENVDELSEALALKPLEKKRLEKAALSVAV